MLLIGFVGIVFVVSRRCSIPLERRLGDRSGQLAERPSRSIALRAHACDL
jgi:hypothetical protein